MPDFKQFRILVDIPSADPALSFGVYAEALAETINRSRPQFAVGIFGPWGSGKTTLMQAVKSRLDATNTVVVDFSAWRYEKEEYLLIPLLDTVREALLIWAEAQSESDHGGALKGIAEKAASTIGRIATSIIAGISFKIGIPGSAELSFEAAKALEKAGKLGNDAAAIRDAKALVDQRGTATFPQSIYHTCFRELQKTFTALRKEFTDLRTNEGDLRFVVFIDDLDRCLPSGALEVLEAIKLFFEHEGFIFVVGLDRAIVERFIEQRYPEVVVKDVGAARLGESGSVPTERRAPLIVGADYIKKIFQVPFTLAPVQLSQLEALIDAIRKSNELNAEQFEDLRDRVLPHLRVALSDVGVNPREVKRFINSYVLQMKIKKNLSPDMVLALQTINARPDWDPVRQAIEVHRDEFLVALRQEFEVTLVGPGQRPRPGGPLETMDDNLRALPQSFMDYAEPNTGTGRILHDPVEATRIDEYLFSVESATSSNGIVLLNMLQPLTKAKNEVLATANSSGSELTMAYNAARERVSNASSMLASVERYGAIQSLGAQLEALATSLSPPSQNSIGFQDENKKAAKRVAADIDAVIRRIRTLRRQDASTAPQT